LISRNPDPEIVESEGTDEWMKDFTGNEPIDDLAKEVDEDELEIREKPSPQPSSKGQQLEESQDE
jgi:putative SOS response-associated peptidase YedK